MCGLADDREKVWEAGLAFGSRSVVSKLVCNWNHPPGIQTHPTHCIVISLLAARALDGLTHSPGGFQHAVDPGIPGRRSSMHTQTPPFSPQAHASSLRGSRRLLGWGRPAQHDLFLRRQCLRKGFRALAKCPLAFKIPLPPTP